MLRAGVVYVLPSLQHHINRHLILCHWSRPFQARWLRRSPFPCRPPNSPLLCQCCPPSQRGNWRRWPPRPPKRPQRGCPSSKLPGWSRSDPEEPVSRIHTTGSFFNIDFLCQHFFELDRPWTHPMICHPSSFFGITLQASLLLFHNAFPVSTHCNINNLPNFVSQQSITLLRKQPNTLTLNHLPALYNGTSSFLANNPIIYELVLHRNMFLSKEVVYLEPSSSNIMALH